MHTLYPESLSEPQASVAQAVRHYLQRRPGASPEEIASWMASSRRLDVARPFVAAIMAAIKTG
ncbi:MAG: hypothetical protein WD069_12765 [Planctomycetales bacterium]